MAHTEKMEETFAKIYEQFISEIETSHKHIHSNEDKFGPFPFFSSLNEEQKKMYLEVVKRISIDAVSTILNIMDHTDGLDITLEGEKVDMIVEEFLIADSNSMGPKPPPPMF